MVLIGFNYLETPGKQISLFERGRQENDGGKEKKKEKKKSWFRCLNSKAKKKKTWLLWQFHRRTQKIEKIFLAQQMGLFVLIRTLLKKPAG